MKSAPELWAECSDAASLARHLGAFGEIRITKLEPETAVAWEGDAASGTVKLEPSGWGTRVILTVTERPAELTGDVASGEHAADKDTSEPAAELEQREPAEDPEGGEPAPDAEIGDGTPPPLSFDPSWPGDGAIRAGRLGKFRLMLRRRPDDEVDPPIDGEEPSGEPAIESAPVARADEPESEVAVEAAEPDGDHAPEALAAALDSLGRAHHRPYSRG